MANSLFVQKRERVLAWRLTIRVEAIPSRVEAIAIRVEVIASEFLLVVHHVTLRTHSALQEATDSARACNSLATRSKGPRY